MPHSASVPLIGANCPFIRRCLTQKPRCLYIPTTGLSHSSSVGILVDETLSTVPNFMALHLVIMNGIRLTNMMSPVRVILRWAFMIALGTSWYSVRIVFGFVRVVLPCKASTLWPNISSATITSERVTGQFLRRSLSTMSRYVLVEGKPIVFSVVLASFAWLHWRFV